MSVILKGRIRAQGVRQFTGYRLTAVFDELLELANPPIYVQNRLDAQLSLGGKFTLELPDAAKRRGPVHLLVTGPDGGIAGRARFSDGDPTDNLDIPVDPPEPTVITGGDDRALSAPVKFTGVAITPAGRGLPPELLVVLWGLKRGAPLGSKPAPFLVARTTVGGYFSALWPDQQFDEVSAVIQGTAPIPILLEDRRLPLRLVVVAPDPSLAANPICYQLTPPRKPDETDISANPSAFSQDISRCVDFTMPNRTVEEVTYQAVVRTTQPDLKPPRRRPPRPLPPWVFDKLAELARRNPEDFRLLPDATAEPAQEPAGMTVRNAVLTRARLSQDVTGVTLISSQPPTPSELIASVAGSLQSTAAQFALPEIQDNAVLSESVSKAERFTGGLVLDAEAATLRPLRAEAAKQVLDKRSRLGQPLEFEESVLSDLVRSPTELTAERLLEAERTSVVRRFSNTVRFLAQPFFGRFVLDTDHQINWEQFPDAFQATTIAHGHIITFKQVWRADGYSLGDLLYSLPLAPGQQKLISILDWDRNEVAARRASRLATEDLAAELSHDRDVSDVIRATLTERMDASSHADTEAVGGGIGGFLGPLVFGAAGGVSSAGSTASQTSGRDVSGFALNRIRDRTLQAASAVRGQRTSVVQTARQGESVRAQTEVVANYNHCHAVTIEYFEVLRHLQASQEVAYVQECLFIPFGISPFNNQKTLRWREALEPRLRERRLRGAFDSLARVEANWQGADYPTARYADDPVRSIIGEMWITVRKLPRPADDADNKFVSANWDPYKDWLWDTTSSIWTRYMGVALPADRDRIWYESLAPGILARVLDSLKLVLEPLATEYNVDATLVSRFQLDSSLLVSLRVTDVNINRLRAAIFGLTLKFGSGVPAGVEILVDSMSMSYRTDFLQHDFFANRRVLNDLSSGDVVQVNTPLDRYEKHNPRQFDRRMAARLVDHLNEHIEFYHRAIWLAMDPNRRYLLLDGFIAPNAGGRSVASVVENRMIGIVGNCLVMPVAPGQKLDKTYQYAEATQEDLRLLYGGGFAPPMRISLPTSGVFAEAVMGHCNSCEKIDDTRFWRWEDAPFPDTPTAIGALSTASRRTTPPNLAADQFPDALVRMQTAPAAPDPTGLKAAVQALGVNNIFKDLTGVALNQQNAASALKASIQAGQAFATNAAALAQQQFLGRELDRSLEHIKSARGSGLISDDQAKQLTESALRGALGEKRPTKESPTKSDAVKRAIERVPTAKQGSLRVTRPEGTVEVNTDNSATRGGIDVKIDGDLTPVKQPSDMVCWAAGGVMMASWRTQTSLTFEAMLDSLGGNWRSLYDGNQGLSAQQFRAFAGVLGWVEEGPASYTPEGLARLLASKGPLLEIGDDGITNNQVVHVRIITAIKGDGTPENTFVTLADSATGTLVTESFTAFDQRHAANDPVNVGLGIFHY